MYEIKVRIITAVSSHVGMDSYYTVPSEIRNNKQIGGLKIVNIEIKLSQFADDTAILLDGTEFSLQKSLEELNSFC